MSIQRGARLRDKSAAHIEAWILVVQRLLELSQVDVELSQRTLKCIALQHDLAGKPLADLDLVAENVLVVVQFRQGRNRHHLRDSAEEEDRALLERSHVLDHIRHMDERIGDHRVETLNRVTAVLGLFEVVNI